MQLYLIKGVPFNWLLSAIYNFVMTLMIKKKRFQSFYTLEGKPGAEIFTMLEKYDISCFLTTTKQVAVCRSQSCDGIREYMQINRKVA